MLAGRANLALRQVAQSVTFELLGLVDEFLLDYATGSPRTLQHYQDQVGRAFLGWCNEHELRDLYDVTPEAMRLYMRDQKLAGLSPSSVSNRFIRANRFLNWCVEQGYLGEDENPMRHLKRPKAPKGARQAFTREEVRRLFAVLDAKPGWTGARDRAIITLLYGTGMRAMECANLRLTDILWPQKRLLIRQAKGGKFRRLPLGKGSIIALREWLKVRPDDGSGWLWLSQRQGPMKYGALEIMTRHLGEYAGVKPCHLHRFRHTFATEHYLRNRDILALKNLLGHEDVKVTMVYLGRLGIDYAGAETLPTPDDFLPVRRLK